MFTLSNLPPYAPCSILTFLLQRFYACRHRMPLSLPAYILPSSLDSTPECYARTLFNRKSLHCRPQSFFTHRGAPAPIVPHKTFSPLYPHKMEDYGIENKRHKPRGARPTRRLELCEDPNGRSTIHQQNRPVLPDGRLERLSHAEPPATVQHAPARLHAGVSRLNETMRKGTLFLQSVKPYRTRFFRHKNFLVLMAFLRLKVC